MFSRMLFTLYKTRGRGLQNKKMAYMEKITVDLRLGQVKSVVNGEASSWKSVPQSSGSC